MGQVIAILPDRCFVKHGRIDHVREFVESTLAILGLTFRESF
jgi:hypothetical protein